MEMNLNRTVNVKNRSAAGVGYTLPDTGVRRTWEPNEVKKAITVSELEQATYIPGGFTIIQDYLLINDKEVCEYLGLETEPEYFYSDSEVKTLLSSGSLDQFLDCLDFAPDGVLDLIKKLAVETSLNDVSKREAIKTKLGLDVSAAIANKIYSESKDEEKNEGSARKRRSTPVGEAEAPVTTGRRSAPVNSVPSYNRVEK